MSRQAQSTFGKIDLRTYLKVCSYWWNFLFLWALSLSATPLQTTTGRENPNMANIAAEFEVSNTAAKRPPRANKACVPCRTRKAKCDASVVGYPCSNCAIRQCPTDCITVTRKIRTARKATHDSSTSPAQPAGSPEPSTGEQSVLQGSETTRRHTTQSPNQPDLDLHYLQILNDTVDQAPKVHQTQTPTTASYGSKGEERFENSFATKLSQLDDVDREYLVKKGVFDLPPHRYL